MTLSQIDGKENPKIQTINFKDFPIKTAKFSASGNEFIVGSKFHPHFFVYDMLAGQSVKVKSHNPRIEYILESDSLVGYNFKNVSFWEVPILL